MDDEKKRKRKAYMEQLQSQWQALLEDDEEENAAALVVAAAALVSTMDDSDSDSDNDSDSSDSEDDVPSKKRHKQNHRPSKKVVVADWDSNQEKRSARAIEFRTRLKEKKVAAQRARHAADLDLAERVYQALILPSNQGPLETWARDPNTLVLEYLEDFYRDLVAGQKVPKRTVSVLLKRIARSELTDIRQNPRLVQRLVTIGSNPDFRDGFLVHSTSPW